MKVTKNNLMKYNYEGIKITEDEPDDKIIKVWEIDPHPDPNYDVCWVRDYYEMQDYACETLRDCINSSGEKQMLEKGFTIKVKLIEVKLSHYKMVYYE